MDSPWVAPFHISVALADSYVCKIEGVVAPARRLFYKHYIDDIYTRRKKRCGYVFVILWVLIIQV